MKKINVKEKLEKFSDYWSPRIVGELNGQQVKLAKLKGEFIWHSHEEEDEMFWIVKGKLKIEFKDKIVEIKENEFFIVPRGVEHKPIAEDEVHVMLFEPASTKHTGNEKHRLTNNDQEHL
ncbi:cupin domain-containing protein [Christiangramia forsetii]|uniref:Mannose-6-phosphate isomerase n=2 Tax=Christiangramia forsetii TaxID=411153 RepID=A0M3H5_CHRFK|nr:cupin domain-containing protein [Christiangramia forsetii]GGG25852.1 mannose-6-phosphate isomerase [Christiangramia forsetii]CAL67170.1 mannose-6-phosphate isomerase [Christiangramia forsetii KT0803]